jgi:hypothetical protein
MNEMKNAIEFQDVTKFCIKPISIRDNVKIKSTSMSVYGIEVKTCDAKAKSTLLKDFIDPGIFVPFPM